MAAVTSRGASLVQRLGAAGYDWLVDRVDPLGGADHHRRLVEQAAGEVLEIGAGTPASWSPATKKWLGSTSRTRGPRGRWP